jgi:hypothetical protein
VQQVGPSGTARASSQLVKAHTVTARRGRGCCGSTAWSAAALPLPLCPACPPLSRPSRHTSVAAAHHPLAQSRVPAQARCDATVSCSRLVERRRRARRHRRGSCGRLWPRTGASGAPSSRPTTACADATTVGPAPESRVASGSRRTWLSVLLPSPSRSRLGSSTDADTRPPPSTSRPARILVSIPPALIYSLSLLLPSLQVPPSLPPPPPPPPFLALSLFLW